MIAESFAIQIFCIFFSARNHFYRQIIWMSDGTILNTNLMTSIWNWIREVLWNPTRRRDIGETSPHWAQLPQELAAIRGAHPDSGYDPNVIHGALISAISPLFAGSIEIPPLFSGSLWSFLSSYSSAGCQQAWGAPKVLGRWIGWLGSDGVYWGAHCTTYVYHIQFEYSICYMPQMSKSVKWVPL